MRYSALATCILLLSMFCTNVTGSAIPMWEFLSRGEKMSHLFNMFVKQVEDYCDSLSMPDCNKVLLVYGLTNLAKMEEESLDKMDPYQRGATDIIWESMMKGTYKTASNTKEPLDYSYIAGNGPNSGTGENNLGSQEEASTNVQQYLTAIPNKYVIGPMVVRVLPDGRPVPGDSGRPLPKDEDAEEFKLMRSKPVPSVEELMSGKPYNQESQSQSSVYSGRFEQASTSSTGTQQQLKSPSQPQAVYVQPPSQFRISSL